MYDLDEDMYDVGSDEDVEIQFSSPNEWGIIPKEGYYLGLDISQNSSGICYYKNGVKLLYNSSLDYDKLNPHAEALLRKQLKNDLLEVIDSKPLDLVVIEDVYEGNNPDVARRLFALNTAIDDLIIDGLVTCKQFVRVSNVTWKSWLSVLDTEGKFKGYKDKERVKGYLSLIGISDSGNGFQDRLDATGMLIGYFLKGKSDYKCGGDTGKRVRVNFNDIIYSYDCDPDIISMEASINRDDGICVMFIDDTRMSKKKMVDYLSSDISNVYITKNPIRLGLLADTLGLDYLDDNVGYFGFWVSERNQKKYVKK